MYLVDPCIDGFAVSPSVGAVRGALAFANRFTALLCSAEMLRLPPSDSKLLLVLLVRGNRKGVSGLSEFSSSLCLSLVVHSDMFSLLKE